MALPYESFSQKVRQAYSSDEVACMQQYGYTAAVITENALKKLGHIPIPDWCIVSDRVRSRYTRTPQRGTRRGKDQDSVFAQVATSSAQSVMAATSFVGAVKNNGNNNNININVAGGSQQSTMYNNGYNYGNSVVHQQPLLRPWQLQQQQQQRQYLLPPTPPSASYGWPSFSQFDPSFNFTFTASVPYPHPQSQPTAQQPVPMYQQQYRSRPHPHVTLPTPPSTNPSTGGTGALSSSSNQQFFPAAPDAQVAIGLQGGGGGGADTYMPMPIADPPVVPDGYVYSDADVEGFGAGVSWTEMLESTEDEFGPCLPQSVWDSLGLKRE